MPKVNVYLPDDLATAVRNAGIPVSAVCQRALEHAVRHAVAVRDGVGGPDGEIPAELPPGVELPRPATPRLVRVLTMAFEEARRRDHGHVGTEHLLLGILNEGGNLAVRVIGSLDVLAGDLRAELEAVMGQTLMDVPSGEPALSPAASKALELMAKEGAQLRHGYLGCEHLLLGLVRETEGLGGRVLASMGLDVARVRQAVIAALSGFVHARANPPSPAVEELLRDLSDRVALLEARLG
ncbi:MAG TPA: Clp protease N-terminal domain-containing protein [Egibacteraceae bacterium]|jgi:ATP-dependent Clp protease ATP-binding subunit ClpA|nr:Clp protease N-terminal domain-containing protein [Egibacteraceae bacterium]